ncbi:MAG: hypothetical protein AB1633_07990 [Elusimicrobiota bacterium]
MKKWEYKSLEWIHEIREKNYDDTKEKSMEEVINNSTKFADKIIKELNLKKENKELISLKK